DAGDLLQLGFGEVDEAHPVHAMELLVEEVATLGYVLLAALALEPLADSLFGRRALDEVEPVATGSVRSLRRQDLHDLAVLQFVVERDHAAVDLGADAAVTDFGVDAVGEVDRVRDGVQVEYIACGRVRVIVALEQSQLA